ncbi:MAG: hypothetical protein [Bacteriophage sp.]|nr:MAG: hypothetical protein [Bacteriophage sp.]
MIVISRETKELAKFILDCITESHKGLEKAIFNNNTTEIDIGAISNRVTEMIEIMDSKPDTTYLEKNPVPIFSYRSNDVHAHFEVCITISSFYDAPDKDSVGRNYTHNKGIIKLIGDKTKEETIFKEVELPTMIDSCFFTVNIKQALELVKVVFDLGVFDSKFKLVIKDDE